MLPLATVQLPLQSTAIRTGHKRANHTDARQGEEGEGKKEKERKKKRKVSGRYKWMIESGRKLMCGGVSRRDIPGSTSTRSRSTRSRGTAPISDGHASLTMDIQADEVKWVENQSTLLNDLISHYFSSHFNTNTHAQNEIVRMHSRLQRSDRV